jgi:hypothetical protein
MADPFQQGIGSGLTLFRLIPLESSVLYTLLVDSESFEDECFGTIIEALRSVEIRGDSYFGFHRRVW